MEQGTPEEVWNCRIDTSGRILIPRAIRSSQELKSGDEIVICRRGDEFFIQRSDELLDYLLGAFRAGLDEGLDLVEELLEERKAEAQNDA